MTSSTSSGSARPTGRAGSGTTRRAGTRRCSPPACASSGATTCGSATRSCGGASTAASALATAPAGPWDGPAEPPARRGSLFDDAAVRARSIRATSCGSQLAAVAGPTSPAGSGCCWRPSPGRADRRRDATRRHAVERRGARRAPDEVLGPRPVGTAGQLEALADEVREALGAAELNPDSQPDCCAACARRASMSLDPHVGDQGGRPPGMSPCSTTRSRPACSPRTAGRGWTRGSTTAGSARLRAGGVVTGRWATSGGGALQLPQHARRGRADEGWKLVVADASQLEPRVLAAMSGDAAMAAAGRHADLYQGMVDAGIVETRARPSSRCSARSTAPPPGRGRAHAPPHPRVPARDRPGRGAARAGERGEVVSTWLGRSSPPRAAWQAELAAASAEAADATTSRRRTRAGLGPVHAQLRGPGHGCRVGAVLDGSLRRRLLALDGARTWCSSCTTR